MLFVFSDYEQLALIFIQIGTYEKKTNQLNKLWQIMFMLVGIFNQQLKFFLRCLKFSY